MLWNITNVILFHALIGPRSSLLQLMHITIKPLSCCVILLLIMTWLVAIKYHVIIQIINYLQNIFIYVALRLCLTLITIWFLLLEQKEPFSLKLSGMIMLKQLTQMAGRPFYFVSQTLNLYLDPYVTQWICLVFVSNLSRFKHCLRFCESDEDRARADALANTFLLNDNVRFWKEVSKMNRTDSNVLTSTINGITGENTITKVWYGHYYKLLNSNGNTSNQPYVEYIRNVIVYSQSVFSQFSSLYVKHGINKL